MDTLEIKNNFKKNDKLKKKENETHRPTIRGMHTFYYSLN